MIWMRSLAPWTALQWTTVMMIQLSRRPWLLRRQQMKATVRTVCCVFKLVVTVTEGYEQMMMMTTTMMILHLISRTNPLSDRVRTFVLMMINVDFGEANDDVDVGDEDDDELPPFTNAPPGTSMAWRGMVWYYAYSPRVDFDFDQVKQLRNPFEQDDAPQRDKACK